MPIHRKPTVKKARAEKPRTGERRTAAERRVVVPHEELNAVEAAVNDAQLALKSAYARLKKWYRS